MKRTIFFIILLLNILLVACRTISPVTPIVGNDPLETKSLSSPIPASPTKKPTETKTLEPAVLTAAKAEFIELYGKEDLSDGKIHLLFDMSSSTFDEVKTKEGEFVSTVQTEARMYLDGKWVKGIVLGDVCRATSSGDYYCLGTNNGSVQINPSPYTIGLSETQREFVIKYFDKNFLTVEADVNSSNPDVDKIFEGVFPEFNPKSFNLIKIPGYSGMVIPVESIFFVALTSAIPTETPVK